MCGRFTQADIEQLDREIFKLLDIPNLPARYNLAPTQDVAVIREGTHGRSISLLRWGLIPSWATDKKVAMRTINARAESLATKPAFRDSFRSRRCVVPASGFYEWKKVGATKQPFYIRPAGGGHFAFAGLWDQWFSHTDGPIETFTIVTTNANEVLKPLHDRMPLILDHSAIDTWLAAHSRPSSLEVLLKPAANDVAAAYPVSTYVNAVANEGGQCIQPIDVEV